MISRGISGNTRHITVPLPSILGGSSIWFLRARVAEVKCRSVCVWGEGVAENPAENECSFPRETEATSFLSGSLPCIPALGTNSCVCSGLLVISGGEAEQVEKVCTYSEPWGRPTWSPTDSQSAHDVLNFLTSGRAACTYSILSCLSRT